MDLKLKLGSTLQFESSTKELNFSPKGGLSKYVIHYTHVDNSGTENMHLELSFKIRPFGIFNEGNHQYPVNKIKSESNDYIKV